LFLLIDRYIAKMFFAFFLGGLVVFLTLFVSVDFMSRMVRFQAPTSSLIQYYILYSPSLVYQLIPVACLLATVLTLSALGRNNELVALFSSGMSLARISSPIMVLVIFISALSFWLGDKVIPVVNQKKNYVDFVEIRKQPGLYSTVKTNRIWYRSGDILFNIKVLQPEKKHAQGITLYYFDNSWHLNQIVQASDVDMQGSQWHLSNGTVTLFANETAAPVLQKFESKNIVMSEDIGDLQNSAKSSDVLSIKELGRFIQKNKEAGLDTQRYEVDYQSKFSFAFAAFVMCFIGIPFSVGKGRSGSRTFSFGVCIALTFVYYAAYTSGLTLGQQGALSPFLAAWVPNILMLTVSFVFLLRLKR
jgi:lipopolysaccharide export system permease protein